MISKRLNCCCYANSNTSAQTYVYNGLGDRVRVEKPTGARHFVYDTQGRVVAEYGASTSEVKAEFIWALPPGANDNSTFGGDDGIVGYAPLALVTTNAANDQELYWVHGNHLGVPIVTTNALGQVVDPGTDFLRPGFPGQSQVLSDLYYNRARDYDPVLGRYIQADPIGLLGDVNPYLYANGDPVNMIDPNGLRCLILASRNEEPDRYDRLLFECLKRDRPNELHVFGHGASDVVCVGRGRRAKGECMTARQFYQRYRPVFGDIILIKIYSCNTGVGENSFAEQTANLWGVPTFAPTNYTWWTKRGMIGIAGKRRNSNQMDPSNVGNWRGFSGKRR